MIGNWLRHHRRCFSEAVGRFTAAPGGSVLNVLVVAIALALPLALQVLIDNAQQMAPAFEDATDLTLYLQLELEEGEGRSLSAELAARNDVESTRFISKAEGLEDLRSRSGLGNALDALSENPLPHVIKLRPARDAIEQIDALAATLDAIDDIDFVQLDRVWAERLAAFLSLGERAINVVSALLAAAVILVIGNTIRLEINNRTTEIEVQKLVGGTDAFIRRPFLYSGLVLGLSGALTAAILITVSLWLLAAPVRDLASLYGSDFALTSLGGRGLLTLTMGGSLLGLFGAWLATARHLRAIEPA